MSLCMQRKGTMTKKLIDIGDRGQKVCIQVIDVLEKKWTEQKYDYFVDSKKYSF